jgi:replication factor A1
MTDYITIAQAKKTRSGINVAAEVGDIAPTRTVNLKNGTTVDVTDAVIFDAPGEENTIKLTLWGEDITLVAKGARVTLENGYTNEFKGEVSLTKGKFGKLSVE